VCARLRWQYGTVTAAAAAAAEVDGACDGQRQRAGRSALAAEQSERTQPSASSAFAAMMRRSPIIAAGLGTGLGGSTARASPTTGQPKPVPTLKPSAQGQPKTPVGGGGGSTAGPGLRRQVDNGPADNYSHRYIVN
jgi:hypothetical protein